jgi:DNA polymerase III subunit delta'
MPFRAIAGHRALVQLLTRAIVCDTLPQSLVFAGPDGVGKRLAAISVAQTLNCPNVAVVEAAAVEPSRSLPGALPPHRGGPPWGGHVAIDACGECSVCRRIASGVHPDVIQLAPDIGIDDIRGAIESAGYRPFEGKRRVFILDGADRLSSEIQNALLKTLEEPPRSSSFVLITSRPDSLLPTVLSRCPVLRFSRLPIAEVERLLQEQHGLPALRAHDVALASEGSLAQAMVEASDNGEATRQLVQQVLQHVQSARTPADRLGAASRLLEPGETRGKPRAKGNNTNSVSARTASDRELLGQRLSALAGTLRDLAATITGANRERVTNELSPALQSWGARAGVDRLVAAFEAVGRAQAALDRNVGPKVIVDWLAFQL